MVAKPSRIPISLNDPTYNYFGLDIVLSTVYSTLYYLYLTYYNILCEFSSLMCMLVNLDDAVVNGKLTVHPSYDLPQDIRLKNVHLQFTP